MRVIRGRGRGINKSGREQRKEEIKSIEEGKGKAEIKKRRELRIKAMISRSIGRKGIVPAVSTIIITAVLLTVLGIGSFVSMEILEMQVTSTEFEQAKSNMLALNQVIQDVALRLGYGSYLQFNQRSGGLGVYETAKILRISTVNYAVGIKDVIYDSGKLYELVYRGGSRTVDYGTVLAGTASSVVNMSDQFGYVRVDVNDGARVILDFNRVRIVTNSIVLIGSTKYNFTEISLIRLERGPLGGSGTINLKVQNIGTNVITRDFGYNSTILQIEVVGGGQPTTQIVLRSEPGIRTALILTETVIRVSMR